MLNSKINKLDYRILFISSLFINIMSLALPLMTLQVYDRILVSNSIYTLSVLCLGVIVVSMLEAFMRYLRFLIINSYGMLSEGSIYNNVINKVLPSNGADFNISRGVTYYINKLSKVSRVGEFINVRVLSSLVDIPFIILFMLFISYIGGWLVIVPIVLLSIYVYVIIRLNDELKKCSDSREDMDVNRNSLLIESLRGIHSVKSLSIEKQFEKKYEDLQCDFSLSNYKYYNTEQSISNYHKFFSQIVVIITVSFGVALVLSGNISLGGIIACVLLVARIMRSSQKFVSVISELHDIHTSTSIFEDAKEYSNIRNKLTENIGQLTFENVSFGFNDQNIISNLNLVLSVGDSISISGTKGVGKTTILKIIFGLYRVREGIVKINGENVLNIPFDVLSEQVAFLSLNGVVFRGTIFDNISLFGKYSEEDVEEISRLIGLDKEIKKLPEGYHTVLEGTNSDIVSPGIKQRIALARSLVCKPKIILMDNTDKTLDREGYNSLYNLLLKIKNKVVLVIVSDDKNLKKIAKKHYLLKDKELVRFEDKYDAYNDLRSNLTYKELPV